MTRIILDPLEGAVFKRHDQMIYITGLQIKQRASKYKDPIRVSPTATIGITEDDKPYLEWTEEEDDDGSI